MTLRLIMISAATAALLTACATQPNNPNYQYSTKYKGSMPTSMATNHQVQAAPVTYAQHNSGYRTQTQMNTQTQTLPASYSTGNSGNTGNSRYATYTRVDELCLQAGTPVRCYPEEFTTDQTEAIIHAPYQSAPNVIMATNQTPMTATQQTRVTTETIGTPGFHAMQNIETDYAYPETQNQQAMTQLQSYPQAVQPVQTHVSQSAPAATMPMTVDMAPRAYTDVYSPALGAGVTNHRIVEGDTVYSMSRQLCVSINDIKSINGLDDNFSLRLDDTIRLPASRC